MVVHALLLWSGYAMYEERSIVLYAKNLVSGGYLSVSSGFPVSWMYLSYSSQLMAVLYGLWSAVPWFDILMLKGSVVAQAALLLACTSLATEARATAGGGRVVAGLSMGGVLGFENVCLIEPTRFPVVLVVSVVVLLVRHGVQSRAGEIFFGIALALTVFVRTEVFFYALFLMVPLLAMTYRQMPWRVLFLPVLTTLLLWWMATLHLTPEDRQYEALRPYQFSVLDYSATSGKNHFDSPADSAAILAVQHYFLNDPAVIQPSLLSKYYVPLDKTPRFFAAQLLVALRNMGLLQRKVIHLHGYYGWAVLLVLLCGIGAGVSKQGLKALATGLYFVAYLGVILLLLKIENRILYPALLALLLTLLSLVPYKRWLYAALFLVGVVLCRQVVVARQPMVQQARQLEGLRQQMHRLSGLRSVLYVCDLAVLTQSGLRPLEEPFHRGLRVFSIDNGPMFLNAAYGADAQRLLGTAQTTEAMRQIAKHPECYVWVGTAQRLRMLQLYFKEVHGWQFSYTPLYPTHLTGPEPDKTPALYRLTLP